MDTEKRIVLFDGYCNLCNGAVQLVLKNDEKDLFLFGSLQSTTAKDILKGFGIDNAKIQSIILIEQNQLYIKSDAALRIARNLQHGWKIMYWCILIPKPIRDFFYDIIARNRYTIFGKQNICKSSIKGFESKFI